MKKRSGQIKNFIHLFTCSFFLIPFSVSAQFTITPSVTNATCPADSNGSVSVSVSGGASPYIYQWFPDGQTTPTITGLVAGTYSLTITNNAAMDSTIIIFVSEPAPITDNDTIQAPVCTSNGYIVLSPAGGTAPYQFAWSTGQVVAGITQLGAGDYSVIVTDANNCTASFSYPITEAECFVSPEDHFTPNGDGFNDTWAISNSEYFPDAKVIVYNRWGTRVYEHKGLYEPWDGKSYLGIPVPDAEYYFFFYQNKDDKAKAAKYGSIAIIR